MTKVNLQKLWITMSPDVACYCVYICRSELLLRFPADTIGRKGLTRSAACSFWMLMAGARLHEDNVCQVWVIFETATLPPEGDSVVSLLLCNQDREAKAGVIWTFWYVYNLCRWLGIHTHSDDVAKVVTWEQKRGKDFCQDNISAGKSL